MNTHVDRALIDSLEASLSNSREQVMNLIRERDEARERLASAEAERDVLLACRHGDQRCFECPDTKCCDNLNEAAKGGRDVSGHRG